MEEAGATMPFRSLDAHVNLAWLYYYTRDYERAEREAREAIASVPREYLLEEKGEGTWPDTEQLPHTFYWFLLGKVHLLLGEIALRQFEYEGRKDKRNLQLGGFYYTLSLAYDQLYARDFRDLRRAVYRIYIRVRRLNDEEFGILHDGVSEAVETYGLETPTRLDMFLSERHLPQRPEAG
jgi:hypothetical protein